MFAEYMVRLCAAKLDRYVRASMTVESENVVGEKAMVRARFALLGIPVMDVDWRLDHSTGRYQVQDVLVDGKSLVQTRRSEFLAIMMQDDGACMRCCRSCASRTLYREWEACTKPSIQSASRERDHEQAARSLRNERELIRCAGAVSSRKALLTATGRYGLAGRSPSSRRIRTEGVNHIALRCWESAADRPLVGATLCDQVPECPDAGLAAACIGSRS